MGVAALTLAVRFTALPSIAVQIISGIFLIAIVYQISVGAGKAVDVVVLKSQGKKIDRDKKGAMTFLSTTVKWIIWFIGALMILSNLGVNITSLIAGLGIGGVAIAFALQNILSDLFSSFAIFFDKPFEVGDMIVVGDYRGTVEKIGIKSTRIRSLHGEEIIISNQDLMSARLQNFRKLKERRASFSFGVLYETPTEKVEKIPAMVTEIIKNEKQARFDRVHFESFGDSALNFSTVYYVTSSEYAVYMDTQQSINLAIMRAFEKEGIEFAYPTQTLYVKK